MNSFKILQDRSKTNIFVSNCLEGKTKKNEASFFSNKAKKNEYNRSATIEDLPLLVRTSLPAVSILYNNDFLYKQGLTCVINQIPTKFQIPT